MTQLQILENALYNIQAAFRQIERSDPQMAAVYIKAAEEQVLVVVNKMMEEEIV